MSNMYCFLCLVLLMAVGSSKGNSTVAATTTTAITSTVTTITESIQKNAKFVNTSNKMTHVSHDKTPNQTSALISTPNKGSAKTNKDINPSQSTVTDNCLFSLKNDTDTLMKLVIASLLLACLVLLISTLVLSCKVCHLKSHLSNSYVVRDNGDLYPTQSKGFTRVKPDSVESEQETCPMINMTSKPEEDGAGTVKKEEDGEAEAAAKQDGDHTCTDEAEENKKPAAETAATQEDKAPEQITVEKEDAV